MFENSSVEGIEEDKSKGLSSFLLFHLLTLLVREPKHPQRHVQGEPQAVHMWVFLGIR